MPKFAFVSQDDATLITDENVKRLYVVAHVSGPADKNFEVKRYPHLIDPFYYDREQTDDDFISILEYSKTINDTDVVVFQCQLGRSRSYEAASILATLLNQELVYKIRSYEGVLRMVPCELAANASVENNIDRINHRLKTETQ